MKLLNRFFFEKIHSFFILYLLNLNKNYLNTELIFIEIKNFELTKTQQKNFDSKLNILDFYLLFSKKTLKILLDEKLKIEKKKKVYFPKNPEIEIINIENINVMNFNCLNSDTNFKLKLVILKRLKKNLFKIGSMFFSNHFILKARFKIFSKKIIFLKITNSQVFFLENIKKFYIILPLLEILIFKKMRNFFFQKKNLKKKINFSNLNIYKKIKNNSEKKKFSRGFYFSIFFKKKNIFADLNVRKNFYCISSFSKNCKKLPSLEVRRTIFVNPSIFFTILYQFLIDISEIFIKKLIYLKDFEIFLEISTYFFHLFSESIRFNIFSNPIIFAKKEKNLKDSRLTFFLKLNQIYPGFIHNFNGFCDLILSFNFLKTYKRICINLENGSAKNIPKITFLFLKKKNKPNYLNLKSKKIKNIINLIFLFNKKNFGFFSKKEINLKKSIIKKIFFSAIKNGFFSHFKNFISKNKNFFFLNNKIVLFFRKNFFTLLFYWSIKKIKWIEKKNLLFLKLKFLNFNFIFKKKNRNLEISLNSISEFFSKKVFKQIMVLLNLFKTKKFNFKEKPETLVYKKNIGELKNISFHFLKKNFVSKSGKIQIYSNMILLKSYNFKKNITIAFRDVKFIFFFYDKNENKKIIHFHLWKSINLDNGENLDDIQFYFDEKENFIKLYNRDEIDFHDNEIFNEEQQIIKSKKLNENFFFFLNFINLISGKNIEISNYDLGFCGILDKSYLKISPSKNCLLNFSNNISNIFCLSELDFVYFERIYSGVKNFDLAIIYNWFGPKKSNKNKTWSRLSSISFKKIFLIQNFFQKFITKIGKGNRTINWEILIENIGKNRINFFKKKKFKFFIKKKKKKKLLRLIKFSKKNFLLNPKKSYNKHYYDRNRLKLNWDVLENTNLS
jgi:hypothetical protein